MHQNVAVPPQEQGGNLDIRYLRTGTTIYLPCMVDGCGLAVGGLHYAQGDGEVSGSAIEMGGSLTVTTRLVSNPPDRPTDLTMRAPPWH